MKAEYWHRMTAAAARDYLEWWMESGDCDVVVRRGEERGYVMIKLEETNGEKSVQPEGGDEAHLQDPALG